MTYLSSVKSSRTSDLLVSASHAARCVACHGVRSHAVPVALVGEYSMVVFDER